MSFSFNFHARSAASAKGKLAEVYAPAAIKLLVEQAIDALPWPAPAPYPVPGAGKADGLASVAGGQAGIARAVVSNVNAPAPQVFGVRVEVWGHMAERAEYAQVSEIQRFIVQPLLD